MMTDITTRLRWRIVGAMKLAAAANRLDVAEHLLQALEILDANKIAHLTRARTSPVH
jgi:hypothetical protein